MNDGSFDNIIDSASCFSIVFPYTVFVNNEQVQVNNLGDLEEVERLLDVEELTNEAISIVYPITLVLADYSELTIDNEDALRSAAALCLEEGFDDDIECADIVYPVTMFTFDTSNQLTNEVFVENDNEMSRFFAGLFETDVVSIQFPVTFIFYDGNEITVSDNQELVEVLVSVMDACDEDDDADFNDDDFTIESFDRLPLGN